MNSFYIEFFEIVELLRNVDKTTLQKKLLKLNNPTYYTRYIYKNPIERHGYTSKRVTNPVLIAITNMIKILKTEKDYIKKLQIEFSWAFNNFPHHQIIDL